MKRLIFILIAVLTGSNAVIGGSETVSKAIRIRDLTSSHLSSGYGIVENKTSQVASFQNKTTEGRVILKYDQSYPTLLSNMVKDSRVILTFDIINKKNAAGSPVSSVLNQKLEITNQALETGISKDVALYRFDDVSSFDILVKQVEVSLDGGPLQVVATSQVSENIVLELQITDKRYYNASNIGNEIWHINNRQLDMNLDNQKDEIEIYWDFKPGYEEYELEWVFVNNYSSTTLNDVLPSDQVLFDFRNNATKVRISENYYRLPLVFDRGYLVYRVRGVHKTGTSYTNEAFSNWSAYAEKGNLFDLQYMPTLPTQPKTPYPDVNFAYIAPFEKDINWQFIATYAEGGLNKSLVNFMDGTMRSRQNVTKNNSDKEVLVSEKIYDYQGRAAVEILPSPAPVPSQTNENAISYFGNFNTSSMNPAKPYSKDDFDWDQDGCDIEVTPLSQTSGTGLYYSVNNPVKKGFNAYLPDANGYAFIQTEYTNDNTGRIKRKSNVGELFRLSSGGKFTEYLYSQPDQHQIDRLFGSNIGYKEHYKRNLVIDPNGQVSVSYLNLSGKVVATALEGRNPANLIALPSMTTQVGYDGNLLVSNNLMSSDNTTLSFVKAFTVTQSTEAYKFNYTIKKLPAFKNDCMPADFCYECAYDILLELKNTDCNTEVYKFPGTSESGKVGMENLHACTLNQDYKIPDENFMLDKGSYMLSKTLTIDEAILERYANEYAVADNTKNLCYEPYTSGTVYTQGCDYTCDRCLQDLGNSFAEFKTKYAHLFSGMSDAGLQSIYEEKVKECDIICNRKSICDISYDMMLEDVSPGGQYGKVYDMTKLPDADPVSPGSYVLSVFNEANSLPERTVYAPNWRHPVLNGQAAHYTDAQGNIVLVNISGGLIETLVGAQVVQDDNGNLCVYPEDLLHFKDFYTMWQPHWAKLLVEHHPEYCYYTWCKEKTDKEEQMPVGYELPLTSNGFDDYLTALTSAYKDNTSQILTNLNSHHLLDALNSMMDNDPFFENNSETVCQSKLGLLGYNISTTVYKKTLMENFMNNYRANGAMTNKGIDVMAWETNNCFDAYYPTFLSYNCTAPSEFYDVSDLANSKINTSSVIAYINYYLHCKNMVKDIFSDCYALTECGCFNECIGRENFNPVSYGMIPPLKPYFVKYWNYGFFGSSHTVIGYVLALVQNYKNGLGKPYYNDDCQPCSWRNKSFFMNRNLQKRFIKNGFISSQIPGGTSGTDSEEKAKADADYNFYLTSGQCPFDKQVESFLNAKTQPVYYNGVQINSHLGTNFPGTSSVTKIPGFAKELYEALQGSSTVLNVINFQFNDLSSPAAWEFVLTSPATTKQITIYKPGTLPSNFTISWVKKVSGFRYVNTGGNGLHNFTVFLSVQEGTVLKDYSCAGSTNLPIGQCYNTIAGEKCYTSDQAYDAVKIAELMCNVNAGSVPAPLTGTLTTTYSPVPEQFIADCHPSSFEMFFGRQRNSNNPEYLSWKKDFNPTYKYIISLYLKRIYSGSDGPELKITLTGPASLDFSQSGNMYHFENFKKTGSSTYSVDVNVTTTSGTTSYNCSITIALLNPVPYNFPAGYPFPYQKCATPEANSCSAQQFKNPERVLDVLKNLKETNHLVTQSPFKLIPGIVFTQELRAALDGVSDIENVYWEGIQTQTISPTGYILKGRIYYEYGGTTPQKDLLKLELTSSADISSTSLSSAVLTATPATEGEATYNFLITSGTTTLKGKSNLLVQNCVLCDPNPAVVNYRTLHHQKFEYNSTFLTQAVKADAIPANGEYNIMSPAEFTGGGTSGCTIGVNNKPPLMVYKHDGTDNKLIWKKTVTIKPGAKYKFIAEMASCGGNFQVSLNIDGDYKLVDVSNINFSDYFYSVSNPNADYWTAPCQPSGIPSQPCMACSSTNPCEVNFEIRTTDKTPRDIFLFLDNIRILEEQKCVPDAFTIKPFEPRRFPCAEYLSGIASHNAATQNNQLLSQLKEKFKKEYRQKCLELLKTPEFEEILRFYSTTPSEEYQYTLYYYDQAGNLVQTVPPQGVNPLTTTSGLTTALTDRTNNTVQGPDHTMSTTYSYNSLNQIVEQTTPDAGLSHFWYDELGRVVFSQNARQLPVSAYSYTEYDAIGRIVEVGEITNSGMILNPGLAFLTQSEIQAYKTGASKTQITCTLYDEDSYPMPDFNTVYPNFTHDNLRNRVAAVAVYNRAQDIPDNYIHATHYSYDIHGNVKSLIQDNKYYADYVEDNAFERYKRIDYEYDLISGRVNKIIYQPGAQDQFMHRYEYDADNRITHVYTSQNDIIWEKDAKYFYYRHGPLARTELGDLALQGIDYAYTLQGWIKGINSNMLSPGTDIGRDAMDNVANLHRNFASDLASYSLAYYEGDYTPIDNTLGSGNFVADPYQISNLTNEAPGLYNGNISHMISTIMENFNPMPQLTAYHYDQLNRIKTMNTLAQDLGSMGNKWTGSLSSNYYENYIYDGNGNILWLYRNNYQSNTLDDMNYQYQTNVNNRLLGIQQNSTHSDRVKTTQYTYDEIGNLTADQGENIDKISWNVYGKVTGISQTDLDPNIEFIYDAMGNRIGKKVIQKDENIKYTFYVRDAQGNILATYTAIPKNTAVLNDFHIYGSSRLGTKELNMAMLKPAHPLPLAAPSTYVCYLGYKRFEISNHLGNVLTIFTDRKMPQGTLNNSITSYKAVLIASQDYSPFGMQMANRGTNSISNTYRFGFNGQEKDKEVYGEGNATTALFWEYDTRIGRRWNVDPKPNLSISNYSAFADNPIWFSDPLGDTVRIKDGKDFINYTPGMEYKGKNKFVSATIKSLDNMNSTKIGGEVLSELGSSENYFDFTNSYAKSQGKIIKNALSFNQYKDGGGEIKAGALLNDYMQEGQKIQSVAHELFHGYQAEKGEKGATINREVGAYLFGNAVATGLGYPLGGFGNFTKAGRTYEKAMTGLLYGNTFDANLYNTALRNLKAGSAENASGLYNNFKILPNDNNPLIKSFYPLLK